MENHQTDEIDLGELAIKLTKFIRRNFWLLAICIFSGTLVGGIIYYGLPASYESKMILQSDILTESYGEGITESLDNLIKEGNLKELSLRLKISEQEAAEINKIEIESIKDLNSSTGKEEHIFVVTVDIWDGQILPKLQEGVIQFLRNNEFVKVRVKQRENLSKTMIDKISLEISSLDSLKKRLLNGHPVNKSAETLILDPSIIPSKIIELNKQKIDFQNSLELSDSIQLVEGFTVFEKPDKLNLLVHLAIGFVGGFFIALVYLMFAWLSKATKELS